MTDSDPKPLPAVELDSELATELGDLTSIKSDLEFVADAADRLGALLDDDSSDEILVHALQTAALIAYARCFASGKRPNKLSESDLTPLDPTAITFHRDLMAMRNKHLAHSVNPYEQIVVLAMLSLDESAVQAAGPFSLKHVASTKEHAETLAQYTLDIIKVVVAPRLARLSAAVQTEAIANVEVLRARPRFTGLIVPGPEQSDSAR